MFTLSLSLSLSLSSFTCFLCTVLASGSVYILSYVYVHQFCVVNDSILCVTVAYTSTVMSITYSVRIYRAVCTVSASAVAVAVAIVSMKGESNTSESLGIHAWRKRNDNYNNVTVVTNIWTLQFHNIIVLYYYNNICIL